MSEETIIHEDPTVKITNLRAVFEGKTYPISNITSVGTTTASPSGLFPMLIFIAGLMMILFSIGNLRDSWGTLLGGLFFLGGGIFALRAAKPTYILQIATAAGEVKALESADQAYIQKITEALNTAIIQKG